MIVALLAWYDEDPKHLTTTVLSLKQAEIGHLVAVDGAYAMFPGGGRHSLGEQHLAIQYAAAEIGIGLTLHAPRSTWQGNEVEKRNVLFALGWAVASEGDWFLVIDADEVVSRCRKGFLQRLDHLPNDSANITLRDMSLLENPQPGTDTEVETIRLYRAQPIEVRGNHWTHHREDGLIVNGRPDMMDLSPGKTDLRLDHRQGLRTVERQIAQHTYYEAMYDSADERLPCSCGKPGEVLMPVNWHLDDDGDLALDNRDVCADCAVRIKEENRLQLIELGFNPDDYLYGGARRVVFK